MPYYKIKTNRFAEWKMGDVAAIDDEAARVPLEQGEIELVEEVKPKPVDPSKCTVCGKVCKSPAGLKVHMRTHD